MKINLFFKGEKMMEGMNPMEGLKIFNHMPNGNGEGFGGGGSSWMVILFLLILFGRDGFGGGNRGNGAGGDAVRQIDENMILNAINGNREAIGALSNATNVGVEGINRGLAQMSVALANQSGDIKTSIAEINSAIATGNQTVISGITNAIHGFESAMTQQNFNLTTALSTCCCQIKEAIGGVTQNILNQTNQLQNTMTQNTYALKDEITKSAFQNERSFCSQNELIRAEGNATRNAIESLSNKMSQHWYDELQSENCGLKAQLVQSNTTSQLSTVQNNILAAINASSK